MSAKFIPVPADDPVPPTRDTSNARYELREKGVFERIALALVLPGDTPAWKEYVDWLNAGNAPAPMPAPPGPSIEVVRAEKKALISLRRVTAGSSGFAFNGHRYDSDSGALGKILARCTGVNANDPLPDGFTWRTADNIEVPMTAKQMLQLGAAALAHDYACHKQAIALKAALAAAADPTTIDIDSGWPT